MDLLEWKPSERRNLTCHCRSCFLSAERSLYRTKSYDRSVFWPLEGEKRPETWSATAELFFSIAERSGDFIERNRTIEACSTTLEGAKRPEKWPATAGIVFLNGERSLYRMTSYDRSVLCPLDGAKRLESWPATARVVFQARS